MSVVFLIFCLLFYSAQSAKILGAVFSPSYSHQIVFHPIWRELSLRGHQVTLLTTDPIDDPTLTNLTEIDLSFSYNVMSSYNTSSLVSSRDKSIREAFEQYMTALSETADQQLSHPQVQNLIKDQSLDFDLLIVEVVYPTQMAFAERFKVPFIGLASFDPMARIHCAIGNPTHPVLYPDPGIQFHPDMGFGERLKSFLLYTIMDWYANNVLYPREDLTIKKHFGDGYPSLTKIQKNMTMLFINSNPVLQKIRPLNPNTIQIGGGIHLNKNKSLPQDIKHFLDDAHDHGVIYFSFGSNVQSTQLGGELRRTLMETLGELPQKILWKLEDDTVQVPPNIKVLKWVPQQAILAHPNVKAFITQCGLQSIEEAILNKVPMLGVPFYGDQFLNANIIKEKGLGVTLLPSTITKENLKTALQELVENSTFKENLEKLSQLYQDQPMSGLEKAVWWTEYVIRHKGAPHLKSPAVNLEWYKYYLLDIIVFFVALIVLIVYLIVKLVKILTKLFATGYRKLKRD